MTTRKHLLRSLCVLVLVAVWIAVDHFHLPHFVKSGGVIGGLGASTAIWLMADRTERQRRDADGERR